VTTKKNRNLFILSGIALVILAFALTFVIALSHAHDYAFVTPIIGGLGIGFIVYGTMVYQRR